MFIANKWLKWYYRRKLLVGRNSCKLFLWHLKSQDSAFRMLFVFVDMEFLLMSDGELKIAWNRAKQNKKRKQKHTLFIGFCVAADHLTLNKNIKRYKNLMDTLMSWIVEHAKKILYKICKKLMFERGFDTTSLATNKIANRIFFRNALIRDTRVVDVIRLSTN